MKELLELQRLETSSDEVSVCAISWNSCISNSCNKSDTGVEQK